MNIDPNKTISYDPDTGVFKWKVSAGRCKAGQTAGTVWADGYRYIKCNGQRYLAHRLAFILMGWEEPDEVDHINGLKHDNRWTNLRPVNRAQNQMNAKLRADNTSGHKGISRCSQTGHWRAEIWINGTSVSLGTYYRKDDAIQARQAAEQKWFGEYAYERRFL